MIRRLCSKYQHQKLKVQKPALRQKRINKKQNIGNFFNIPVIHASDAQLQNPADYFSNIEQLYSSKCGLVFIKVPDNWNFSDIIKIDRNQKLRKILQTKERMENLTQFEMKLSPEETSLKDLKYQEIQKQKIWANLSLDQSFRLDTSKIRWKYMKNQQFFQNIIDSNNLPIDKESRQIAKQSQMEVVTGFGSYCLGFHRDIDSVVNILIEGVKYWYCISKQSEQKYLQQLNRRFNCENIAQHRDLIVDPNEMINKQINIFCGKQTANMITLVFPNQFHSIISHASYGLTASYFNKKWKTQKFNTRCTCQSRKIKTIRKNI